MQPKFRELSDARGQSSAGCNLNSKFLESLKAILLCESKYWKIHLSALLLFVLIHLSVHSLICDHGKKLIPLALCV